MALPYPITAGQIDPKSPVDDTLMEAIRDNLEYLLAQTVGNTAVDYSFKVNGHLNGLPNGTATRIDGALVSKTQTFTSCKMFLDQPGVSGDLEIDIRRYQTPNTPIMSITEIFRAAITGVDEVSTKDTQSITRIVSPVAIQSISLWKTAININSVIPLGSNLVRLNLAGPIDSDWKQTGLKVVISGCTVGANNGLFSLKRWNVDGGNNIVIENASAVSQTGAAGNVTINAMRFNLVNPASDWFRVGSTAMVSDTTAGSANNDASTILAVNDGGNNVVTHGSYAPMVTQGSAAGSIAPDVFKYNFLSAASVTDFVVGEYAYARYHNTASNNGYKKILAVNDGGSNLVLESYYGVETSLIYGTVDALRLKVSLSLNPTGLINPGEEVIFHDPTYSNVHERYDATEINRGGTNNVVIKMAYNGISANGFGFIPGAYTLSSPFYQINFSSNQSAIYTNNSRVTLFGTSSDAMNESFEVVSVNRGGGASYNIVIDGPEIGGTAQSYPMGRVITESRSIFSTRPVLSLPSLTNGETNRHLQVTTTATFSAAALVQAGTPVGLDILSVPTSDVVRGIIPSNLVVQLS